MRETSHYESAVVTVRPEATLHEIADTMDLHAVGCVVVVDDAGGAVGIVTDRDLVRRAIAPGRDPEKTHASDVMTADLVTGTTDQPLEQVLGTMRVRGVRRLPILEGGRLAGIVTLDDILSEMARELYDLREAIRSEVIGARRGARSRRRRERVGEAIEDLRAEVQQVSGETRSWIRRELEALRARLGRKG